MTQARYFFSVLTVLAVLVTGSIPQSWMPAMGNDGKVLLVLCSGAGAVEEWVDLDGEDPVHDDTDERVLCPFAGLTADLGVPAVGDIIPFVTPIKPRWSQRDFTHRSAGFYPHYDARGPPVFS